VRCPRCGVEAPDDAWNCTACRINLYWATQHYEGLVVVREGLGLPEGSPSPPFLVKAHKDAMEDRAGRGGLADNKVRAAARKVMRRKQAREVTTD